ncbi:MAG: hypothetical protein Q9227_008744 [Pyrenula ochraceoflavens]
MQPSTCHTSTVSAPPNDFVLPHQDPNIAAATSALIFPQSHELFRSSPTRPSDSGSRRSRSSKRGNPPATSSTRSRRNYNDHEVSEILRNDGYQARHRSPSASRSIRGTSNRGSSRSRCSTTQSSFNDRITQSLRSRADDELEDVGEWGQRNPTPPRVTFATDIPSRWSASTVSSADTGSKDAPARASTDSQTPRRSKFVEGSMSDRSLGISSAWHKKMNITGLEGIDEAASAALTPRPSKGDMNKPLPTIPTPKTTKKIGMFKFGSHSKDPTKDADKNVQAEEPSSRRKGLRSSRSFFNFRLFNTSKSDMSTEPSNDPTTPKAKQLKISKKKLPSEQEKTTNVLNERKRKAEEAYAEQFGNRKSPKKHATDTATRTPLAPSTLNAPMPVTAIRVKPSRVPSLTRKHTQANLKKSDSSRSLHSTSTSPLRKRPSRKDLEQENAELRAMLAQERERNVSLSINKDPLKDRGTQNNVKTCGLGWGLENIPPVPQLPGQGALTVMEGRALRSKGKVFELDGSEIKGNGSWRGRSLDMDKKERFEWPEDVF